MGSKDGVSGLPHTQENSLADESELVLGISADLGEKEPALKFVRETILSHSKSKTTRLLKAGACGNKCLKVIQGEADCALMNFGCSLWDTCATEALVLAAGGHVVTLFGWNIGYGRRDEEDKRELLRVRFPAEISLLRDASGASQGSGTEEPPKSEDPMSGK